LDQQRCTGCSCFCSFRSFFCMDRIPLFDTRAPRRSFASTYMMQANFSTPWTRCFRWSCFTDSQRVEARTRSSRSCSSSLHVLPVRCRSSIPVTPMTTLLLAFLTF
jgi:hypothetical protein